MRPVTSIFSFLMCETLWKWFLVLYSNFIKILFYLLFECVLKIRVHLLYAVQCGKYYCNLHIASKVSCTRTYMCTNRIYNYDLQFWFQFGYTAKTFYKHTTKQPHEGLVINLCTL